MPAKRAHARDKGKEMAGEANWAGGGVIPGKGAPTVLDTETLGRLYRFYVMECPCGSISSSGVSVRERGWGRKPWGSKEDHLRRRLLDDFGFVLNTSLFVATATDETRELFRDASLSDRFHKSPARECIAFYNSEGNQFMSILLHIRNAMAHGRFCAKSLKLDGSAKEPVLILENVKPVKASREDEVRARMVLRLATLEGWMKVIERRT